ncbi:uncharacterized protein LOC116179028 [Photinus pyralis]|nr:uncharacterized protein LOC116179028 [Photinus pyralis]XP_031354585.1 uncharacterized protein LOC116179028 [Photinus pyralis]XP_031354586.1 uncharacterized protein LOC116179028 [Photinus pyralis]XP_031354587.1 uncharacterized protein LOC116179028 [Photinus pyralis]
MPADEDYGRRHSILQHSASPAPAVSGDRFQTAPTAERFQQERPAIQNEQAVQSVDRLEPPERFQSVAERFTNERSSSDRLPSGERYQGVSERYPLGECMQTTVSTERITQPANHCHAVAERSNFQPDRYQQTDRNQKYPDRFTPIQNIGSLDRYHNHGAHTDRYSRTNTPTDRYHTLYTDKERCSSSADRYTPVEKYASNDSYSTTDRHSSQNINTLGRHTPTDRHRRVQNERDQYFSNSVAQNVTSEAYKRRERSRSSERKSSETFQAHTENFRYGHDATERYSSERFPPIPCPERFATQERTERPERITFTQVPYMAPPSPAPASDRFIPPPPLSPTNTPSPDCYASNTFPSPTNPVPAPERFVPPPPLSPSPTETFSPKKQRYAERFANSSGTTDRYSQYQQDRYKERNQYYSTNERYPAPHQTLHAHNDRFVNIQDRFNAGERTAAPPNPHTPVERYTPQQQEPYYPYDRYPKYNASNVVNSSDPYMRRDLAYQQQFRVAIPFQQNPYQRIRYMGTPSRTKCCQYQDCYQLCKSSPCSSSSSSVTSQGKEMQKELISNSSSNIQDVQCQNLNGYQQEKAIQCNNFPNKDVQCAGYLITTRADKKDASCTGYVSPNLRTGKIQCRHGVCSSPSVEYVGQSGGRHVCATPPPRGSIGSVDGSVCSDQCCVRRSQNTLAVTVW